MNNNIADDKIIELVYDYFLEADGGYVCDVYPGKVVAAIRKVLEYVEQQ